MIFLRKSPARALFEAYLFPFSFVFSVYLFPICFLFRSYLASIRFLFKQKKDEAFRPRLIFMMNNNN